MALPLDSGDKSIQENVTSASNIEFVREDLGLRDGVFEHSFIMLENETAQIQVIFGEGGSVFTGVIPPLGRSSFLVPDGRIKLFAFSPKQTEDSSMQSLDLDQGYYYGRMSRKELVNFSNFAAPSRIASLAFPLRYRPTMMTDSQLELAQQLFKSK